MHYYYYNICTIYVYLSVTKQRLLSNTYVTITHTHTLTLTHAQTHLRHYNLKYLVTKKKLNYKNHIWVSISLCTQLCVVRLEHLNVVQLDYAPIMQLLCNKLQSHSHRLHCGACQVIHLIEYHKYIRVE